MTTFKEIRGTTIEVVSSDPANPELGQIWYNSSSGTLKGYKTVNTWSAGGNLNNARRTFNGGAGTQTATIVFGGRSPATPTQNVNYSESYNGSAWTNTPNINTATSKPCISHT